MVGTLAERQKAMHGFVLIPLKSGHGWHEGDTEHSDDVYVLIPLKSGHGWHIKAKEPIITISLNPFEIRAWLAHDVVDELELEAES